MHSARPLLGAGGAVEPDRAVRHPGVSVCTEAIQGNEGTMKPLACLPDFETLAVACSVQGVVPERVYRHTELANASDQIVRRLPR
jgi:hypothetical protein